LKDLFFGGQVVLTKYKANIDFEYLVNKIKQFAIKSFCLVPSVAVEFIDYVIRTNRILDLVSVENLVLVGEFIHPEFLTLCLNLFGTSVIILNMYGPTECTINSSMQLFTKADVGLSVVPIGPPLPNYKCHVLNKEGNEVIPGCIGTLYISGPHSVMRKYLNLPEKTAETIVSFPQRKEKRMYNTGDLVKMNKKGELVFIGRNDHQVKIRGQRVELEEADLIPKWQHFEAFSYIESWLPSVELALCLESWLFKKETPNY